MAREAVVRQQLVGGIPQGLALFLPPPFAITLPLLHRP
jgi:hypothetical protein